MKQQLTKKLIRATFLKQLNEMPLNKITVKGLSEEAGINRNTFYYHYQDVYGVLAEIFDEALSKVIALYDGSRSWEETYKKAMAFAIVNKKAIFHIYYSLRREDLENYFNNVASMLMERFVGGLLPETKAKDVDRKLIATFFANAMSGITLAWVSDGMKEDPDMVIDRIGFLFDGCIEEALRRSEASNH